MAALVCSVSLSMGLHLCCLKSIVLLQVWLCSRTSKCLSLGMCWRSENINFMHQYVKEMYEITLYSPCLLT
jgi:hypothetical protein